MKVLVSGISGLGGHLAPALLDAGHEVVGMTRDPARVAVDVPCVRADAVTGDGLDDAMEGAEVAYYLIHTYEQAYDDDLWHRELKVARNFANAARDAGVRRIVYLGVPPSRDTNVASRHIRSRLAIEDILMEAVPDSVSVGAFAIVSARSRSIRVLMEMVRTNNVVPLPPAMRNRMQPVDIRDVFACLVMAAAGEGMGGRRLRIGGPEIVSWEELLRTIACAMGAKPKFLPVPFRPPPFLLRHLAKTHGGNPALLLPLFESMAVGDVLADPNDLSAFGIKPRPLVDTVSDAVEEFLAGTWRTTEGQPLENLRPTGLRGGSRAHGTPEA